MNAPVKFDAVSFIIAYESGELDQDQVIEGVQSLIDSGIINHLQGHYGRLANALQSQGLVSGF
jgi:hypothetical protein